MGRTRYLKVIGRKRLKEIIMRQDNTKWQAIKDYFNSKKSGKIFTRKEYFDHILIIKKLHIKESYLDFCRCILEKAGYLTNKNGVYKKVKPIPQDISRNMVERQAYPKSKRWKRKLFITSKHQGGRNGKPQ